jgi:Na+-translocating ferredoxin:NAD+ oxidoreductase RnfD subunit
MIVLFKVGRLDTTLTFIIAFFILEYCRTVLFLGWGMDVLLHKFTNGSFLLFAFFMITDPKTTPDHPKGRIAWAIIIALIAFVMSHWMYLHTAPIWALVMITPVTVLLDKKLQWKRFKWIENLNTHSSI